VLREAAEANAIAQSRCADIRFVLALQLAAAVYVQAPLAIAPCGRAEHLDGQVEALRPLEPPDEREPQRLAFGPRQGPVRFDVERVLEQARVRDRDLELAFALRAQIVRQHADDSRSLECIS